MAVTTTLLRYRWVALTLALVSQWSNALTAQSLAPLAPLFQPELGITKAEVGIFASSAFAGTWMVLLLSGSLSDRFGVRKILSWGQVVMAIPMLLMAMAGSFFQAVAIMLVAGIARGTTLPGSTKAIMDWFPPGNRATAMGLKQAGVPVAGMFTASVLPAIGLALGWRNALALVGLWIIAGGVITGIFYRDVESPPVTVSRKPGMLAGVGELIRNPNIWFIGIISTFFVTAQLSLITYLPLYFKEVVLVPVIPDASARIVAAGGYLAVTQAGGIFGRVFWGFASDRFFGGRRMVVMGLVGAISAAASVAVAYASGGYALWALTALVFVYGATGIGWNGLYHTLMAETAGRRYAATGVGLVMSLSQVGAVVGPPLFGFIVDVSGSYRAAWLFLAALGAAAALSGFLTASREKHID